MKKTLVAAAVVAALATSAFAEITFGAWLRVLAAPVASNGDDTVVAMTNSWGYGARTARLNVNAVSEDGNAGFAMGIYNDASMSLTAGDEAQMWVKPVEQVKVSVGKYDNNTLRGDLCYGSWNWMRCAQNTTGEGFIMSGNGETGLMVEVTPIDALYIQAMLPIAPNGSGDAVQLAEDAYKEARGGFAYTIDGLGKLKAQYIGNGDDRTVEAEFDLTAVDGLYVCAGVVANIWDDAAPDAATTKIAAGASYQINDALKVSASGEYQMYDDVDASIKVGAGVDYALADGLNAVADVRALIPTEDYDDERGDPTVSFMVGIQKNVSSNGYIGVAFQGVTNGGSFSNDAVDGTEDNFAWAIPVAVSVYF